MTYTHNHDDVDGDDDMSVPTLSHRGVCYISFPVLKQNEDVTHIMFEWVLCGGALSWQLCITDQGRRGGNYGSRWRERERG